MTRGAVRPRPAAARLALYGYLGSGNIGNDASFETVLNWLRTDHPDVAVCCVTIAPEQVRERYGVPALPLTGYVTRPGTGRLAAALGKVRGRSGDLPRALRLAGSVDAVVVPGMGVLEESLGVRPWGLPAWLLLTALACRVRGRRFVLLDVGAEPARNPVTRRLFAATARLARHVSYRDELSADAMRQAGAGEPDAVAPDLAFAHPSPADPEPEAGRVVVGVMAYYGTGDDPVRGAAVRRAYVETLTDALVRLLDAGDRLVLLGGDRVDVEVADEVADAVRAARPGVDAARVAVRDVTTFAEVCQEMARAELVIASRYHTLVAAVRLARPTVSLSYAAKSGELMRAVGLGGYDRHIEQADPEWLWARLRAARAQAPRLSAAAATGSARYAEEVRALLHRVSADVLGEHPVVPR